MKTATVFKILLPIIFLSLMVVAFGEELKGNNPSYYEINNYIERVTDDTRFDPELVKAIAWRESLWRHFDTQGRPDHKDEDWGIMRINKQTAIQSGMDLNRIKTDWQYNIRCGVRILETKYQHVIIMQQQKNWRKIQKRRNMEGKNRLEIAIKLYNGAGRSDWLYLETVMQFKNEKPWMKNLKCY